ncbi:hypothetical protein CBL_11122 [Carabus blaptoides fortunei]
MWHQKIAMIVLYLISRSNRFLIPFSITFDPTTTIKLLYRWIQLVHIQLDACLYGSKFATELEIDNAPPCIGFPEKNAFKCDNFHIICNNMDVTFVKIVANVTGTNVALVGIGNSTDRRTFACRKYERLPRSA